MKKLRIRLLISATPFLSGFAGIFAFLMMVGGGEAARPIKTPASEDQAFAYYSVALELGTPWDLIILIDTFVADKTDKPDIEGINPLLTSLEFCELQSDYYLWEIIGQEDCDDGCGGDNEDCSGGADIFDWVFTHTQYISGKAAIMSALKLNDTVTVPELRGAIEDYDDEYSGETQKRETQIHAVPATEFRSIITENYSDLFDEQLIDDIMELYESRYLFYLYSETDWFLLGGMNATHSSIAGMIAGDDTPFMGGGLISPLRDYNWADVVSCEFGTGYAGHTGIDFALPTGTPIRAAASGRVLAAVRSFTGYGHHVVIFHGIRNGESIVTLYAHNSEILVNEGDQVSQGQIIALSGNTGNSTGPHLHLEFIIDGEPREPRNYLP